MRTRTVMGPVTALVLYSGMLAGCGQASESVMESQAELSRTPPPFSAASKAQVERAGNEITPLNPDTVPPGISVGRAQQVAIENFALLGGRGSAEAQYASVTNKKKGAMQADHSIKPSMQGRRMWLLLYHDVEMAFSVPRESEGPLVEKGDFLVYVDANTGEIPRAETIE